MSGRAAGDATGPRPEAEPAGSDVVAFGPDGLVPAVVQDATSHEVLMVAYMNAESLRRTLETKRTWFYSRSRRELWPKGETSGNRQWVRGVLVDCDGKHKSVLQIIVEEALRAGVEDVCVVVHPGDEGAYRQAASRI